jgi:hypothetical protein
MDEDNTFIRMDMRANITPQDLRTLRRHLAAAQAEIERLQSNDNWPAWEAHHKAKFIEANQDAFEQRARADKAEAERDAAIKALRNLYAFEDEGIPVAMWDSTYKAAMDAARAVLGVTP